MWFENLETKEAARRGKTSCFQGELRRKEWEGKEREEASLLFGVRHLISTILLMTYMNFFIKLKVKTLSSSI